MGRPKTEKTAAEKRSQITLENHPQWLTYADVQVLLKQYQGVGYGHKRWNKMVATREIPAWIDPWSKHIRYKWEDVREAIEKARRKV